MAITSKAASIVDFLGHSFSSFRQSDIASNRAAILSAIAMGFLLKTLLLGKNNRLIKSPEAVVRTKDGRVEEYDFIIIGGGGSSIVVGLQLGVLMLVLRFRDGWLCHRFKVIGGPFRQSPAARIRYQVGTE